MRGSRILDCTISSFFLAASLLSVLEAGSMEHLDDLTNYIQRSYNKGSSQRLKYGDVKRKSENLAVFRMESDGSDYGKYEQLLSDINKELDAINDQFQNSFVKPINDNRGIIAGASQDDKNDFGSTVCNYGKQYIMSSLNFLVILTNRLINHKKNLGKIQGNSAAMSAMSAQHDHFTSNVQKFHEMDSQARSLCNEFNEGKGTIDVYKIPKYDDIKENPFRVAGETAPNPAVSHEHEPVGIAEAAGHVPAVHPQDPTEHVHVVPAEHPHDPAEHEHPHGGHEEHTSAEHPQDPISHEHAHEEHGTHGEPVHVEHAHEEHSEDGH